jgi:hypothetical protein
VGQAFRPANRVACGFSLSGGESRRPLIFRLKPEATRRGYSPVGKQIVLIDPSTHQRLDRVRFRASVTADPLWLPLFVTPQHPEYVSGHSTNSSAMATTLMMLFGDDPGVAIVATSPTNPGFERHWATLSEGVEEVIDARIYSGIHYRTSDEEGARLGRRIARFVVNHALRAAKHLD